MKRITTTLKVLLTAILIVLLVKTFAFTSCSIPSTGMENTLYQGEKVLVNKWSYGWRIPFTASHFLAERAKKGDVVLFNNPVPTDKERPVFARALYISRCVGAPGDTLMLNSELLVTGERALSPDSKQLYAKAMKYFIVIALMAFLVVVFYMDILRHIINSGYWQGLKVVPIIMAAEIFMGIYFNLSFWYKLNDETYWGAIFSFIGCAVLFAVNILFVPKYGYIACAWASFAGYFSAMVLSYAVGQKRNAINYEMKEIFKYTALFAILYCISLANPFENSIAKIACNTVLLFVYVAYFIKKDLPLKNVPIIGKFFR